MHVCQTSVAHVGVALFPDTCLVRGRICLFSQPHSALVTVAVSSISKSDSFIPPNLLFFFTAVANLRALHFHSNATICLSLSTKTACWGFDWHCPLSGGQGAPPRSALLWALDGWARWHPSQGGSSLLTSALPGGPQAPSPSQIDKEVPFVVGAIPSPLGLPSACPGGSPVLLGGGAASEFADDRHCVS